MSLRPPLFFDHTLHIKHAQPLKLLDDDRALRLEAFAQQLQVEGGNMAKILAAQAKAAQELARRAAAEGLAASHDADLILGGLGGIFTGAAIAEKLDIPFIQAYLYPFAPTREFASVLTPLPQTPVTSWANGLTHRLARQMMWQSFRGADGKSRLANR